MAVTHVPDQIVIFRMLDSVGVYVVKAMLKAVAPDHLSLMISLVSVENLHIHLAKEDALLP